MADAAQLIEAIAADLEGLPLPRHRTVLYLDPPVVRSDQGPVLAVFVRETDYDVMSTSAQYEDVDTFVVAWFEPVNLDGDLSTQAADALANSNIILDHLKTYTTAIPGLDEQAEATLVASRRGIVDGSLWLCEARLRVVRWTTSN